MEEEINCHDFYISLQVGKENKLMNEKEKRKNWGESFSEIDQLEKGWKEDNITLVLFPKFTLQKWWGKNRGEGRPFNKAGKFVGTMENERIAEKLRDPEAYYLKWKKTILNIKNKHWENEEKKIEGKSK